MPMESQVIARQEGPEFRTVCLELQADGAIRIHAYDKGTTAFTFFGRDEYEFWVTIPASDIAKLAMTLLKAKYQDNLQAVTELRDFCKQNEVVSEFGTW